MTHAQTCPPFKRRNQRFMEISYVYQVELLRLFFENFRLVNWGREKYFLQGFKGGWVRGMMEEKGVKDLGGRISLLSKKPCLLLFLWGPLTLCAYRMFLRSRWVCTFRASWSSNWNQDCVLAEPICRTPWKSHLRMRFPFINLASNTLFSVLSSCRSALLVSHCSG